MNLKMGLLLVCLLVSLASHSHTVADGSVEPSCRRRSGCNAKEVAKLFMEVQREISKESDGKIESLQNGYDAKIRNLQNGYNALTRKLRAFKTASDTKLATVKAEVASVRTECHQNATALQLSTETKVNTLNRENAALSNKVNDLSSELAETKNDLNATRSTLETTTTKLKNDVKQLNSEQNARQAQLATVKAKQQQLATDIAKVGSELQTASTKLDAATGRQARLITDAAAAVDEVNAAKNRLAEVERQQKIIQVKLKAVRQPPTGFQKQSDENYYKRFTDKVNWADAKEMCEKQGSVLALDDSASTHEALKAVIGTTRVGRGVWLGVTDQKQEGKWMWVDGRPVSTYYWNSKDKEPNGGRRENCLEMYGAEDSYTWNDLPCDSPNYKTDFICQFRI